MTAECSSLNSVNYELLTISIIKSLEEYADELIKVLFDQLKLLGSAYISNNSKNKGKSNLINYFHQINLNQTPEELKKHMLKLLEINKRRLEKEFRNKIDELKAKIKNDEHLDLHSIHKLINFDLILEKFYIYLNMFDSKFAEFLREFNKKMKNWIHSDKKLTDFNSDTECIQASQFISDQKYRKIFKSLKNLSKNTSIDDLHSDCEETETKANDSRSDLLRRCYSETELDNIYVEDFMPDLVRNFKNTIETESQSNSWSTIDILSSDTSTHESEINAEEKQDDIASDRSNDYATNSTNSNDNQEYQEEKDMDCIIIENDSERECKNKMKKEEIKKIMDELIIVNQGINRKHNQQMKKMNPFYIGMRVFALRDKVKHKWKLARIVRIIVDKEINNSCINEDDEYYIKLLKHTKLVVNFDIEDDDEEESSKHQDKDDLADYNQNEMNIDAHSNRVSDFFESDEEHSGLNEEEENSKRRQKKTESLSKRMKKELINNTMELDPTCVAYLNGYESLLPFIGFNKNISLPILAVRSRVVTYYQLTIYSQTEKSDSNILLNNEYFASGTIIESPGIKNFNRYLVFFDNGCVSYVKPDLIFPIADLFTQPNERIHSDHMYFLLNYFYKYPERRMVKLALQDQIEVFLDDKWYTASVVQIDCSLVKFQFENNLLDVLRQAKKAKNRKYSIWLYRGSYKIRPLYNEFMADLKKPSTPYQLYIKKKLKYNMANKYLSIFSSSHFPMKNKPLQSQQSTKPKLPQIPQGQLKHLDLESYIRNEIIEFFPHPCTSSCVFKWENMIDLVKCINPLLVPLLHGWQRHICHQSKTLISGSKKWVNYVAPCGRMLRSTGEVDRYLAITNSKLTIDMFSFDYFIYTDREFEANAEFLKIDDITNGQENVHISCVNCIDNTKPDLIEYSAQRIPLEGVPLNTDPALMEGCGCTDNCRDRMNCACWRKTFEATTFMDNDQMNTSVGYRGKRLTELVQTGIFECNSNCKCDYRCSNRVAQNGISARLQLFKTSNKGWGLRCLDDITKGSFICTYAGHLLTENQSDIRAQELGDEYFAELDFVECIRKLVRKGSSDLTSDEAESINIDREESLLSNYYIRPKQSKKNEEKHEENSEIDYIFLDSGEDEQDIVAQDDYHSSQPQNNMRIQERRKKETQMLSSINSNRFFTNSNNKYFYMDYLDDKSVFIMDAKICGNIGRYFNHSCSPNIFVQNVFVDTYDLRFPWIAFFAKHSIKAGTELCWVSNLFNKNYSIQICI